MNAPDSPEFKDIFEALPIVCALLSQEFKYIAATDAYVAAGQKSRKEIIGGVIYEVFPDNPLNEGDGPRTLQASLRRAVESGETDDMGVIRYDIQLAEGGFAERWWRAINVPFFDSDGHLQYIIHLVEDINNLISILSNAEEAANARGLKKDLIAQFFS